MSIEVLEPAPSTMLTTVERVKARLGISNDSQDEMIEEMIKAASDFVVKFCGREFALQRVKESLVSKGVPELLLSLTPVVDFEFVEFDDTVIEDVTLYDAEAGIIQRRSGFRSTTIPNRTIDFAPSNYHEKRWHVTYTGGYILPSYGVSQGPRTLPYDLERAVLEIVKTELTSLQFDGTLKSYRIGDTAITWERGAGSRDSVQALVPNSALAILRYYQRPF